MNLLINIVIIKQEHSGGQAVTLKGGNSDSSFEQASLTKRERTMTTGHGPDQPLRELAPVGRPTCN